MSKITDKPTQSDWPRIVLTGVRINGNSAQVYTTAGLFETQRVILQKVGQPDLPLVIAKVLDERFIIFRSGKQIQSESFNSYDECMLTAPGQNRPSPETDPNWQSFQEFPASAIRQLQVSHHGNPLTQQAGQLDQEQPETRFIYTQCELTEIREFISNPAFVYSGNVEILTDGTLTVDQRLPWMREVGSQFVYYELNSGIPVNYLVYTVSSTANDVIKVTPTPVTDVSTTATLDSRIGQRLKSTKFIGDCCLARSYTVFESVTLEDIVGNV